MYRIDGSDITLTRGDTLYVQISLTKDGEPYVPQEGDTIRFAMKKSYKDPDSEVLINKQVPIDTLMLEINPEDTKPLAMSRTYLYDLELKTGIGEVYTFIAGKFKLTEEVL